MNNVLKNSLVRRAAVTIGALAVIVGTLGAPMSGSQTDPRGSPGNPGGPLARAQG